MQYKVEVPDAIFTTIITGNSADGDSLDEVLAAAVKCANLSGVLYHQLNPGGSVSCRLDLEKARAHLEAQEEPPGTPSLPR